MNASLTTTGRKLAAAVCNFSKTYCQHVRSSSSAKAAAVNVVALHRTARRRISICRDEHYTA
eukprot:9020-Heterococcus_DN1.PRE.2